MARDVGRGLGKRDVAGGGDEARELRVGDIVTIDPEARDRDLARQRLFGVVIV